MVRTKNRKAISDIRIYDDGRNKLSGFYRFRVSNLYAATRMAFKLRERGFVLDQKLDHLYIYISPDFQNESVKIWEPRILVVEKPLAPEQVPSEEVEQYTFLVRFVESVISHLEPPFNVNIDMVHEVADQLVSLREKLEITQCSAETKDCLASVVFTIEKGTRLHDWTGDPVLEFRASLVIKDKNTGFEKRHFLISLEDDLTLFALFDKVKITNGAVELFGKRGKFEHLKGYEGAFERRFAV